MDTGASFHISHENVKFEARKYIRFAQDKHDLTFQHDKYILTLKLEKTPDSLWSDIIHRSYGKKTLRFTYRSNGQTGVWFVVRFPIKTIFEKANKKENIVRTVSVGELKYTYSITLQPSIIDEVSGRINDRSKQMTAKNMKEKDENKKSVEYICHNPKPYLGGGFSPK